MPVPSRPLHRFVRFSRTVTPSSDSPERTPRWHRLSTVGASAFSLWTRGVSGSDRSVRTANPVPRPHLDAGVFTLDEGCPPPRRGPIRFRPTAPTRRGAVQPTFSLWTGGVRPARPAAPVRASRYTLVRGCEWRARSRGSLWSRGVLETVRGTEHGPPVANTDEIHSCRGWVTIWGSPHLP